MRLFIAIDFNNLKDYFSELQEHLPKNAKLSLARSFHLTLKFLGNVQPDNIKKTKDELKKIKFEPFSVFLDDIGVFPSEDYVRVVWIRLNPEDCILELQKYIDEKLHGLFKKENDFKPHITLARAKFIEDSKSFIEGLKKINIENKKIRVDNFRLVRSNLTPEGPVYDDLEVFWHG